jgi:hypothetical protein
MLGRTLGHYSIVSELGAGGMGIVYHACDEAWLDRAPPAGLWDNWLLS